MKGQVTSVESYSAFGGFGEETGMTKLCKQLGIKRLFCVGLAYDFCVGSTACDAAKSGLKTYLLTDCTKAVNAGKSLPDMQARLKNEGVQLIERKDLVIF